MVLQRLKTPIFTPKMDQNFYYNGKGTHNINKFVNYEHDSTNTDINVVYMNDLNHRVIDLVFQKFLFLPTS